MTLNDFLSDWVQTVEGLGGFAILGLAPRAWKLMECHHEGCRRIGHFRLGHLRLCRVHHPAVPNDGKITNEHIKRILTRR